MASVPRRLEMRNQILLISFCLTLAACGKGSDNASPQAQAANACAAEAKTLIGDKTYALDLAVLAKNAKLVDGIWQLQSPITIEPGLRDEVTQDLACEVRMLKDQPSEVVRIEFIFK